MDRENLGWEQYIVSTPGVVGGKPAVRGTRLSVEFLLGLFAAGWSTSEVLGNYPSLDEDSLRAVFAFAAELARDERVYPMPQPG